MLNKNIKLHRILVEKVLLFTFISTVVSRSKTMVFGPVRASIKHFFDSLNAFNVSLLCFAKHAAKRFCIGAGLVLLIVWSSVLLFACFYRFYVPSASLIRPAHFKFRVCSRGSGMCSFPVANLTLCPQNCAEVLGRGQQYRVLLELIVPDSASNRDVGMFMVHSRVYSRHGGTVQESSRTASLKYQSDLMKTIQTVVLCPFYVTGLFSAFYKDSQTLSIELFDDFWDDYYQPAVGASLEIQSRQLTFYSAQLQFHAHYSGLRYYLYYYPVTSAVCGIVFNCLWLTTAFILTWYRLGLEMMEGWQSRSTVRMESPDAHREMNGGWNISHSGVQEEEERPRNCIQPFTVTTFTGQSHTMGTMEACSMGSMEDSTLVLKPEIMAVSPQQTNTASECCTHVQPFTVSVASSRLTENVDGLQETDKFKQAAGSVYDNGQLRHRVNEWRGIDC